MTSGSIASRAASARRRRRVLLASTALTAAILGIGVLSGGPARAADIAIDTDFANSPYTISAGSESYRQVQIGLSSGGVLNQSGGTLTSSGADSAIFVGVTATGTYNLSGGTANAEFIEVGAKSTGILNQTGGNAVVSVSTIVGSLAGGAGTYNLSGGTLATASLTLGYDASSTGVFNLDTGGTLVTGLVGQGPGAGTFNFNGGALQASASSTTFMQGLDAANVRDSGAVIDTSGSDITIAQNLVHSTIGGDVATDGGLTKNGAGVLRLSGTNTYNGGTDINAGAIEVTNSSSLGGGTITLAGGELRGVGAVSLSNGVFFGNAASTVSATAGSTLTLTGTQNMANGATIAFGSTGNTGRVVLGGNLVSIGASSVPSASIDYGTVGFGNVSSADVFFGYIPLTIGTNGALDLSGFDTGVGDLDGAGTITNSGADATLTVGAHSVLGVTGAGTFSGIIQDGAGTVALVKNLSGTLTLSGANTYTGGTTVNAGTLALSGSGTLGAATGDTIVNGGTLDLGGTTQTQDDVRLTGGTLSNGTMNASTFGQTGGTLTTTVNADIDVRAIGGSIAAIGTTGVDVSNGTANGIQITTTAAGDINNAGGDGIHAVETGTGATTMTLGGDVTGSEDGIDSASTSGDQTITLAGNTVTGGSGAGVNISSAGGAITLYLDHTDTTAHTGTAATVTSTGGNAATIASGGGAVMIQGFSGTMVGALDGDNVNSGGGAILIDNLDLVQGNGGDGIDAASDGGPISVTNIDTLLGGGGNGILANSSSGTVAGGDVTILGSGTVALSTPNATNTDSVGIQGDSGDGIQVDARYTGAGALSGGDITVGGVGAGELNGAILGADDGLDLTTNGAGTITIDRGADVTGTAGRGIAATSENGDIEIDTGLGGTAMAITGGGGAGIFANATGTGTITIDQTGAGAASVEGATFGIDAATQGSAITVRNLASVTGATNDGFRILSVGGAITVSNIGTISGAASGIDAGSRDNAGTGGNISIQGSGLVGGIEGTGGDGIYADAFGGTDGGDILIGTATPNGDITGSDDGIDATTSGSGVITIVTGGDVTGTGGAGIKVSSASTNTITINSGDTVGGLTGLVQNGGTLAATNNGTLRGDAGPAGLALDLAGGDGIFDNNGTVLGGIGSTALSATTLTVNNNAGASWYLNNDGNSLLAGANDTINNSGAFYANRHFYDSTAGASATTLAGLESFNNNAGGALYIDSDRDSSQTLTLGPATTGTLNFTNNGEIYLGETTGTDAPTFHADKLTVNGNYGGAGTVYVDIDLGTRSAPEGRSDQLAVTGTFNGTTFVDFRKNSGTYTLNPDIVVLDLNGTQPGTVTSDAAAELVDPTGFFLYDFHQNAAGDWVVSSNVNIGAISGLASSFATTQAIIGSIVNRPAPPYTLFAGDEDPNTCGAGVWMRGTGGAAKATTESESMGISADTEVNVRYGGAQVAADWGCYNVGGKGGNLLGGISVGYNGGKTQQDDTSIAGFDLTTDTDFDSRFVAGYLSYSQGRFAASLQARYDDTDFSVDTNYGTLTGGLEDYGVDSGRVTVAATAQYSFDLKQGFSLIPQIGVSYARTDTSSIYFDQGGYSNKLAFDPTDTVLGFAGLTLQKLYILGDGTTALAPSLSGFIYNDFSDRSESTFTDGSTGESRKILTDGLGTYGEIGANVTYLHLFQGDSGPKEFSVSVRGDVKFSNDLLAGGVTAQARLQF